MDSAPVNRDSRERCWSIQNDTVFVQDQVRSLDASQLPKLPDGASRERCPLEKCLADLVWLLPCSTVTGGPCEREEVWHLPHTTLCSAAAFIP